MYYPAMNPDEKKQDFFTQGETFNNSPSLYTTNNLLKRIPQKTDAVSAEPLLSLLS